MASSGRQSSRWGNFFQQAVAGMESRLDTILAEGEDPANQSGDRKPGSNSQESKASTGGGEDAASAGSKEGPEQGKKTNRANDRLQERLARAMANKSSGGKYTGARLDSPSSSVRTSLDSGTDGPPSVAEKAADAAADEAQSAPIKDATEESLSGSIDEQSAEKEANTKAAADQEPAGSDAKGERKASMEIPGATGDPITGENSASASHQQPDADAAEDVNVYLERIDALQAKLKYLADSAAESADERATDAPKGSAEAKLADRDKRIALLLEEGEKLSQNEMNLNTLIRTLRSKIAMGQKKLQLKNSELEKVGKEKTASDATISRLEASASESKDKASKAERQLESLRSEVALKDRQILELKKEAETAISSKQKDNSNELKLQLQSEKSTSASLRDDLSALGVEKKLAEDRLRVQIKEAHDGASRDKERSKLMELELRGEIRMLESRLETYRAKAEEMSSGTDRDVQAKLFRQIEELKTEHSIANENWRSIEGSLVARISELEKDRDETNKKESETRRKQRETLSKSRRLEEELENSRDRCDTVEQELSQERSKLKALQESMQKAHADLSSAKEDARVATEALQQERAEWEKKPQIDLIPPAANLPSRSPVPSNSKSSEKMGHGRRMNSSFGLGLSGLASPPDRASRRSSMQASPDVSNHRQDSFAQVMPNSSRGSIASFGNTPPTRQDSQDDFFDGVVTPATPEKTINGVVSVTTTSAGPSVQLVERMSATVRQLESEKAVSKEELSRLQSQRDEARGQVVDLMRELEAKKEHDEQLKKLQAELEDTSKRYQTTLELLGEKSERVEELEADIDDMKQIYRDQLEKSVR